MKPKLPNLFQPTKTKDQKGFLIKLFLIFFVGLVILVALFFELQFRKPVVLEGVIQSCIYSDYQTSCNYLETQKGNFLLTQGTIDKILQTSPTISLEDKKVRLTGRLSRQKLAVQNLGSINRFQIEKLEFLE